MYVIIHIHIRNMTNCICCTNSLKQSGTVCPCCGYSNLNYKEWMLHYRPDDVLPRKKIQCFFTLSDVQTKVDAVVVEEVKDDENEYV